jgi:hypothetical protein
MILMVTGDARILRTHQIFAIRVPVQNFANLILQDSIKTASHILLSIQL